MKVKFTSLPSAQLIQVIDMNDYFSSGIPTAEAPLTKKQFKERTEQELDGNLSYQQVVEGFYEANGDGGSNRILVTIKDGKVYPVVP